MDTDVFSDAALLRLLQLASPTLPVGAFAYSQGLEWAVECAAVRGEADAQAWILGLLSTSLSHVDIPCLARLYAAWQSDDAAAVDEWAAILHALRESAELRAESRQLGGAAARLLHDLGFADARAWIDRPDTSFPAMFALAAVRWNVPLPKAAVGYAWAWCENQTTCAMKLVPLGQTAGQRILGAAIAALPAAVRHGLALDDDDIGYAAPALAIGSALHETQYSRLFRS